MTYGVFNVGYLCMYTWFEAKYCPLPVTTVDCCVGIDISPPTCLWCNEGGASSGLKSLGSNIS